MDCLGHKKLEKNNGIYSSIDGIQEVGGSISLISAKKTSDFGVKSGVFLTFSE